MDFRGTNFTHRFRLNIQELKPRLWKTRNFSCNGFDGIFSRVQSGRIWWCILALGGRNKQQALEQSPWRRWINHGRFSSAGKGNKKWKAIRAEQLIPIINPDIQRRARSELILVQITSRGSTADIVLLMPATVVTMCYNGWGMEKPNWFRNIHGALIIHLTILVWDTHPRMQQLLWKHVRSYGKMDITRGIHFGYSYPCILGLSFLLWLRLGRGV